MVTSILVRFMDGNENVFLVSSIFLQVPKAPAATGEDRAGDAAEKAMRQTSSSYWALGTAHVSTGFVLFEQFLLKKKLKCSIAHGLTSWEPPRRKLVPLVAAQLPVFPCKLHGCIRMTLYARDVSV